MGRPNSTIKGLSYLTYNKLAIKRIDGASRAMFKPAPSDHGDKTNLEL